MRLRGIPNKFIITLLCESGTYLLRNVPIDGKYIPTQASKAKKDIMRGSKEEVDRAAVIMDMVATESMTVVEVSVGIDSLLEIPNMEDPTRQDVIKQENIVPYGVAEAPNCFAMAAVMAGGHWRTNMYMEASKRACMEPKQRILESDRMTLTASRMVGLDSSAVSLEELAVVALFSPQVKDARMAPRARTTTDNSNGPVGPRREAAAPAMVPAKIATSESPA